VSRIAFRILEKTTEYFWVLKEKGRGV